MSTKRLLNTLSRDLYALEDENDPRGSLINPIWPSTVLDQVYDQLTPGNKTLREIIEDLRYEITTGGREPIKFPVTTVNGEQGDVVITKEKLGMKLVDNTRDIDKPLSNPQRRAVEQMLKSYDFKVDLSALYDHLHDGENPHHVTFEQLNDGGAVTAHMQRLINEHKFSHEQATHPDIRNSISQIWSVVDRTAMENESRITRMVTQLEGHMSDPLAHVELLEPKEDAENKITEIDGVKDHDDHDAYPSAGAVVQYVDKVVDEYDSRQTHVTQWFEGVEVIDYEYELPDPSDLMTHMIYFIRNGVNSHDEIAVCHREGSRYRWRVTSLGSYYKFNPTYFSDTIQGMSIRMDKVVEALMEQKGAISSMIDTKLRDYMPRSEYENKRYLTGLQIWPGLSNGSIRFSVNDNAATMSPDIRIPGLQRLAFLEYITETELQNQSVYSRHIINNSIEHRHLQQLSVNTENIYCPKDKLIGNLTDSSNMAQYISVNDLVNTIRPLITGEIDPDSEAGPTWSDILNKAVLTPTLMEPFKEYEYTDGSFGKRFKGVISSLANMSYTSILSEEMNTGSYEFVDAGGTWQYQSKPDCWTTLGGSNITGHTFAAIVMTDKRLQLESISIGERWDAEYDVWVRYRKK